MLDIKSLRQNPEEYKQALAKKGYEFDVARFQSLEDERKVIQVETQQLQNQRKQLSKSIGMAKGKGEPTDELMKEVDGIAEQLTAHETKLQDIQTELNAWQLEMPNTLHESVPIGQDENDNLEVRKVGEIKPFSFEPKQHFELLDGKGIDFETAAKLSGSRFSVLHGPVARLHRALAQFMLNTHTLEHGYEEVYVPYLVNDDSLFGTGQFPKFKEDQFGTQDGNLWLIPTAEVPLTNLVRDCLMTEKALPKRFVCHSPCFRREAGAYGKDTRGMLRQHQFDKVELVHIVKPEDSYESLEQLVAHAEKILQLLEIPYRVVTLCSGDTGFSAAKTYDIEAWLPGQNQYREISSCSNTEGFQARRLQARWKNPNTNKTEPVHTLNGSGLAVGRTMIALMENYQDESGDVHIPDVLSPYMGGVKVIKGDELTKL